ncbi:MAG: hypothetical protein KUG78_15225 [Kangiellaceae bacterium]|nr:hypothetical protein [Kangiellaceae bacterium]
MTLSCNLGRLAICLGKEGSFQIRSGNANESLTSFDIGNHDDYVYSLKASFVLAAQNGAGRNRTLSLTVTDSLTDKVVFSDVTSQPYGVIKIKN